MVKREIDMGEKQGEGGIILSLGERIRVRGKGSKSEALAPSRQ